MLNERSPGHAHGAFRSVLAASPMVIRSSSKSLIAHPLRPSHARTVCRAIAQPSMLETACPVPSFAMSADELKAPWPTARGCKRRADQSRAHPSSHLPLPLLKPFTPLVRRWLQHGKDVKKHSVEFAIFTHSCKVLRTASQWLLMGYNNLQIVGFFWPNFRTMTIGTSPDHREKFWGENPKDAPGKVKTLGKSQRQRSSHNRNLWKNCPDTGGDTRAYWREDRRRVSFENTGDCSCRGRCRTIERRRETCITCQAPPLLVVWPCALSASAICWKLLSSLRSACIVGSKSATASIAACRRDAAAFLRPLASADSLASSFPSQCPGRADPSNVPRRFAAASASSVRWLIRRRFIFRNRAQNMKRQSIGMGVVSCDKIDAAFHQRQTNAT